MNVIQFFMTISKNGTLEDIKDVVHSKYIESSPNPEHYLDDLSQDWKYIGQHISVLYELPQIIAYKEINKLKYYICKPSMTESHDKNIITFDILVMSDVVNIDDSINIVVNSIKKTLGVSQGYASVVKNIHELLHIWKMKLSKSDQNKVFIKLEVLKDTQAYLFPYDSSEKDIYTPHHKIRVAFKDESITKWEGIRFVSFLVIFVLFLIDYKYTIFNVSTMEDFKEGFLISLTVFLLSDLFIKIIPAYSPFANKKLRIQVNNLSEDIQRINEIQRAFSKPEDVDELETAPREVL